jgi:metal-sulfur cluster biosynthetic enzyme
MELELIDKVDIDDGKVNVDLHLTSPFCPAVFGFKIAQDVKDNIYNVEGIHDVKVNVSNHFMAEAINKQVNESKPPQQQQQQQSAAASTPTTSTTDTSSSPSTTSSSTLDSKSETVEEGQN